jgi:hypothetical protein
LPDVKVITQKSGSFYYLANKWAEDIHELVELIYQELKDNILQVFVHDNINGEVLAVIIGIDINNHALTELISVNKQLLEVEKSLRKFLGINLNKPKIHAVLEANS